MTRKFFSVTLLLALFAWTASAQYNYAKAGKTSFGISAGINFQNLTGTDADGDDYDNDLLTGFTGGINVQVPIAPEFFFQPGLMFAPKGAKSSLEFFGQTFSGKVKLSYIELPLNLLFKPQLGSDYILLGFGPYLAYGVGGSVSYNGGEMDVKFKSKVKMADMTQAAYFKPFDAGANLFAGYEFANKLSFQLNAQLGMLNISPEIEDLPQDKSLIKNTGFGFSLGYRF